MTDDTEDAEVVDLWPYLESDWIDRAFEAKRREAMERRRPAIELVGADTNEKANER